MCDSTVQLSCCPTQSSELRLCCRYEEHLANTGQEPSHALFKEILAGAAGFEVDRLVETKGLDSIDR